MFPLSHKTVLVLDMGPYMARSSGQLVDIETRGKSVPLEKSLWTCSVEGGLEYLRIVSDLFPDKYLVRFMVNGKHVTQSWAAVHLSLEHVMENLAQCGLPDPDADIDHCFILDGLTLAIDAMTLATDIQKAAVIKNTPFKNRGRIIVATHIKNADELEMLKGQVVEQIENANKVVKGLEDKNYVLIDELDVCFLHICPVEEGEIPDSAFNMPLTQLSCTVSFEVVCTYSGRKLTDCMHALALRHFHLGSTTVSGIPMKEEQTAGQSANYDVQLFHLKEVHSNLEKSGFLTRRGEESVMLDKGSYRTLLLQWCSPNVKQASFEQLHVHRNAVKITPAAVNSRPSSCLTSFILSGKTVMLEVPKKGGGSTSSAKTISHMLTSHGGHIYIHNIYLGRSFLDDPPSICEGPGGRVSDYRITDFADLMKEVWLTVPSNNNCGSEEEHIMHKRRHLARLTRFWPLTQSESLLVCLHQKFEPLLANLKYSKLNDKQVSECKDKILALLSMESNKEPLSLHSSKVKGMKREEQYVQLWKELELYIRNYSHITVQHLAVLNCLLQCSNRQNETFKQQENRATDLEDRDLLFCAGDDFMANNSGQTASSSSTQPPAKAPKLATQDVNYKSSEKINLVKLWLKQYEDKYWKNWRDFDGRIEAKGNIAHLYPGLQEKLDQAKSERESKSKS